MHRADCRTLAQQKINKDKLVDVAWDLSQDVYYPVAIEVEAFDRVGIFKDVLASISNTDTNVVSASVSTKRGSSAFLNVVVDVKEVKHLEKMLAVIRSLSDVYDVHRVE